MKFGERNTLPNSNSTYGFPEQYDHKHHKGPTGRSAKFQHGDAQAAHNQGLDMYQWVVDDVQSKRLWEFASKTEQARRDWMAAVKKCAGPVQCFQVQILEVDHLPKTDKMGKCDPQVKVTMGPHSHTTVHQDKTYKASYSQTFDYPAIHLNDLVVEVGLGAACIFADCFAYFGGDTPCLL